MGPDKDEQRDAQEQTSQSASYSAATLHVTGCEKNMAHGTQNLPMMNQLKQQKVKDICWLTN